MLCSCASRAGTLSLLLAALLAACGGAGTVATAPPRGGGGGNHVPTQRTDVATYKNDAARTGQNLTESILTLANVNAAAFGLLRFLPADGKVDAEPLYLAGLSVQGAVHNVVFVARRTTRSTPLTRTAVHYCGTCRCYAPGKLSTTCRHTVAPRWHPLSASRRHR